MAASTVLLFLVVLWDPLSAKKEDFCADQPEAMHVHKGGSVIIPCMFSYPRNLMPVPPVRVYWRAGKGDRCGNSEFIYNHTEGYTHVEYEGRITLAGDPMRRSGSLRIDTLKKADGELKYCCRVHIRLSNGETKEWQNRHMTQLVFTDGKPTSGLNFNVTQPNNVEVQSNEAIIITCHFTQPENKDPLLTGLYWTVGEKWQKFVYHINHEAIDPDYQGRTRLIGDPNMNSTVALQIDNVTVADRKTYYCLVAIRFCNGTNGFFSVIQQGGGTTIIERPEKRHSTLILIVPILALLLILIIAVLCLKKKGLICKGASAGKNPAHSGAGVHLGILTDAENDPPRPAYFDSNHEPKGEEPIVYAALELTKPVHVEARAEPDPQSDTIYSAVKLK